MESNIQKSTDFHIREAKAEDAESIVRLIQQIGPESPITSAYVCSYMQSKNSRILLVEREGCIEGLLSYSLRPDLYHAGISVLIEEFVVDKASRSQGLGSALIAALMDRLPELGCKEICLAVMPDNERAIRFYRSHGLQEEVLFLERHF